MTSLWFKRVSYRCIWHLLKQKKEINHAPELPHGLCVFLLHYRTSKGVCPRFHLPLRIPHASHVFLCHMPADAGKNFAGDPVPEPAGSRQPAGEDQTVEAGFVDDDLIRVPGNTVANCDGIFILVVYVLRQSIPTVAVTKGVTFCYTLVLLGQHVSPEHPGRCRSQGCRISLHPWPLGSTCFARASRLLL